MTVLEKFLTLEFPKEEFEPEDIEFVQRFKINEPKENEKDILNSFKISYKRVTDYYEKKPQVKSACEFLQGLFSQFRCEEFKTDEDILDWWCSCVEKYGKTCYYCEVSEKTLRSAFEKYSQFSASTKKSCSPKLQIEHKSAKNFENNKENCELVCVLCNNAKSDMITAEDFKKYFGKAIGVFWNKVAE